MNYSRIFGRSLPAIGISLLTLALVIAACSNAEPDDELSADKEETTAALSSDDEEDDELGYTVLTDEEREAATMQPWEEPGMEETALPAHVLEARYADPDEFEPHPEAEAILEELDDLWAEERERLLNEEGVAEAQLAEYRDAFHWEYLMEVKFD